MELKTAVFGLSIFFVLSVSPPIKAEDNVAKLDELANIIAQTVNNVDLGKTKEEIEGNTQKEIEKLKEQLQPKLEELMKSSKDATFGEDLLKSAKEKFNELDKLNLTPRGALDDVAKDVKKAKNRIIPDIANWVMKKTDKGVDWGKSKIQKLLNKYK